MNNCLYRFFLMAMLIFFQVGTGETALSDTNMSGDVLVLLKNNLSSPIDQQILRSKSVKFFSSQVAEEVNASVVHVWGALSQAANKIFVHMQSSQKTTEELITGLKNNPNVLAVMPNNALKAKNLIHHARWQQKNVPFDWAFRKIGLEQTDALKVSDEKIYIAVMDTGIDDGHIDLRDNIDKVWSRNFARPVLGSSTENRSFDEKWQDTSGHGTYVTGIVYAVGTNAITPLAVNPNLRFIALKIIDERGVGLRSWMLSAIDYLLWLQSGYGDYPGFESPQIRVHAVNISLGEWEVPFMYGVMREAFEALESATQTVTVVAAGNEGREVGHPSQNTVLDFQGNYLGPVGSKPYPASFNEVLKKMIVTGAISYGTHDTASIFSNWSPEYVDLLAPEENPYGTEFLMKGNSSFDFKFYPAALKGTSTATPHVTGAIAFLAMRAPQLTGAELKETLLSTADSSTNPISGPIAFSIDEGRLVLIPKSGDANVSACGVLDIAQALLALPKK